jgi:putative inorganic carbon (hco3(-)) transporter
MRPPGQAAWLAGLVTTYGLAAFIVSLPLEFTAELMRQQLSRLVLLVVAAALIYLLITRRRSLVLPRFASVYLLLLYLAVSLASWAVTRAQGSASSLLDIALYPAAGLLILNLARSQDDHRRAWIALLISGLAVAALGAFLYVTHLQIWTPNPHVANRMNITFGDPNITARFLTLVACAAVILFAARQGPAWLAIAAAIACAAVTPLTFSRSGLVLFVACVVVAIVFALDHRRAAALGLAALITFAISTGVNPDTRQRAEDAAITALNVVPGFSAHFSTTGSSGNHHASVVSDDNRRYLIAAGATMGIEHPAFGVGFGGYPHALLTTYRRFLPAVYTDSVSHTSLVTVFAEQGIVGLLILLAFLVELGHEALAARGRRDRWSVWAAVSGCLVVPILLYSQFEGRFVQEPYLWLSLGLLYSSMSLARTEAAPEAERKPAHPAAAAA